MTSAAELRSKFVDFRRRLYEERDLTAVDTYVHPEFKSHNALIRGHGRDSYKAFVQMLHTGVPDLRPIIQHVVVEAEVLMSMTKWVGTHDGPFLGVPATGVKLQFCTADRYHVRDGLFFEHWDIVDRLDASLEMGLIVAAPSAGTSEPNR